MEETDVSQRELVEAVAEIEAREVSFHRDLAAVMAEVGYVQKDGKNDFHGYKYASAEAVLRKVNAALAAKGIAVGSSAEIVHHDDACKMAVVKVTLHFHRGACRVTVEGLGQGSDKGDKAVMKANTAALKYALANAFMISWGDDPEASAAHDEEPTRVEKKAPVKKAAAAPANDNAKPALLPPDVEQLTKAIQACDTLAGLELVKERIQAAKEKLGGDSYRALGRIYGGRKKALDKGAAE
jgi:hypothetical protein